ncbi:MAG: inner membrane CreD family protein [Bacteroidales bacterium]|nr:inner membrane CreD family protein [Bacteroidales bacterium]
MKNIPSLFFKIALAYAISYVLIQMETYAFLAGTLILFAVLCAIMYLTRNMSRPASSGQ